MNQDIYSPYVDCIFKYDRIGNLQIWQGTEAGSPDEAAYVQNSQNIDAIFEYATLTEEDKEALDRGWAIAAGLHEDMVAALFDIPL